MTGKPREAGPPAGGTAHETASLTKEERKSLTHGEFWIPEHERIVYQKALRTLNRAGVPYVVSGLYAIYEYTGIYRQTKDLDLFFVPGDVVPAARALKQAGFDVHVEQAHWLAKAWLDGVLVDLIFGMGNGLAFIDQAWYEHSRAGVLAAEPVRISPPEELIWHRLFVSERHRWDMADIVHLIVSRGDELRWERLIERVGDYWRLLLAQVLTFDFVYPGHRQRIPTWVREDLLERTQEELQKGGDPGACWGTMISRFSFAIDVNEWGFADPRASSIADARATAVVQQIVDSDVWQGSEQGHAA